MNGDSTGGAAEASNSTELPVERPHIWIRALTFSDGTTLELQRNEIVVIVGPNNAGKSAALREMYSRLREGTSTKMIVLKDVAIDADGSPEDLEKWMMSIAALGRDGAYRAPMLGAFHPGTGASIWANRPSRGLQMLSNWMITHLNTEARLSAINPVQSINFSTEVATHPLHQLHENETLEADLDRIFFRAFGQNLVVNRGAGSMVMLHVGKKPIPPAGKDRVSLEYRSAVHQLSQVNEQGDGIRAFVGVIASVRATDRDIILIDEPEAFLHPPQAYTLGRVLAEETPTGRQLIVSTHSSDFLRGILDHSSPRVRVIRIRKDQDINRVTELQPGVVKSVWSDPLLRYSKVFDGLFHDGVIVCEADADCRFYGAMLDVLFKSEPSPDLALVYGAGKTRISTIVKALRAINVPVRVVADFDILSDENDFSTLVQSLGGNFDDFRALWNTVKSSIDSRRAQLPAEDAKKAIDEIFRGADSTLSEKAIREIRDVLKRGSAWAEAKKLGKAFVPSGQQYSAFETLSQKMKAIGLYIVEVGEIECFCKSIPDHGPKWVAKVLERDLARDSELQSARDFVKELGTGWKP